MDYSRSLPLYQDRPAYGLLFKLIIAIVPVGLLASSIYVYSAGDSEGGLVLLLEALFIGVIFWAVFPRNYQVYEDHLRIVLGGPFSIKIGFNNIKSVGITGRLIFTMNFVTRITTNYVTIEKKRGMNVAITPTDGALFVENANRALNEWNENQQQSRQA